MLSIPVRPPAGLGLGPSVSPTSGEAYEQPRPCAGGTGVACGLCPVLSGPQVAKSSPHPQNRGTTRKRSLEAGAEGLSHSVSASEALIRAMGCWR